MGPVGRALPHALVNARDRQPAGGRMAADLVESQEAMKAIEGGILERLCHHRTGELLNLECEAAVARNAVACAAPGNEVERQRIPQEIENREVRTEPIGTSIGYRPFDDPTLLSARTPPSITHTLHPQLHTQNIPTT